MNWFKKVFHKCKYERQRASVWFVCACGDSYPDISYLPDAELELRADKPELCAGKSVKESSTTIAKAEGEGI